MAVPAPGQVIDRYQVQGPIGAGSMGDVVKAIDVDLKRTVALKILSDKHRGNQELEARFVREGRAVAAISHANVVQVFTTGNWDERPYIAMEFLTGTDLGSLVAQNGPMTSLDAARAVLDSALGLNAAFEAGLIHRDVKPANLVRLDNGAVKVTDFGLAKPVDPKNEPALTAMGVVVGTPDYIAPEQARGEAIDEKVDVYALGGTLYYLLVGTPPFRKGNPVDDKYLKVVARHLRDPAPNPMLVVPNVDGALARLQLRMMAKLPNARPAYADLVAELSEIVEELGGRLHHSSPMPAQSPRGSRPGPSAKTPYLGGSRLGSEVTRLATDDRATHAHVAESNALGDNAQQAVSSQQQSVSSQQQSVSSQQQSVSSQQQRPSQSIPAGPGKAPRSRLLISCTIVSAIVLAAGLVLYFAGPLPSKPTPAVLIVADAAPPIDASTPDAAPRPPKPPAGTMLVPRSEGRGAAFLSLAPVSYNEFSEMFPNQKRPTKNATRGARAVTGVEYAYAEAFARTKGGRLPTPGEFAAAVELAAEGFSTGPLGWEWLDDGTGETNRTRATGNGKGETRAQRPKASTKIGFRIAFDLK